MDGADRASRVHISLSLASELETAVRRSASRIADASCRSRQILKSTSAKVRADLFRNAVEAATFSKVSVNLAIPGRLVSLTNEGG